MKSNSVLLKHILTHKGLSSGYSVRGKISNKPDGGVRIIQLKDFNDDYTSIGQDCFQLEASKIKPKYYLDNGDVLFIAKGANNYALVYEKKDRIPTIASSALFVIKIDKNIANPKFVSWYINQHEVQNYFKTNEAGTYVTNINRKTIEEIPIQLPSLSIQDKIANVAQLHVIEKQLTIKINDLNDKLITSQLFNQL
ncbi:hypothetical protein GCM10009433_02000 [Psychroflexus lacisalsi]|jgi:restriction endonuclease S subunit|uniref:Type I restriction modification DNA specificity domain-containing protein n=1 Tax=Psychroflexus lacisalsi TaxID=503928 RepID=A0ABN1K115_9FLAO